MTILYIGTLQNSESVPVIDTTIIVEFKDNVDCFDSALFP
jgi:hypothetical protein